MQEKNIFNDKEILQELTLQINAFVYSLCRENGCLDSYEDYKQDAWNYVLKYSGKWDKEKGSLWTYNRKGLITFLKRKINKERKNKKWIKELSTL